MKAKIKSTIAFFPTREHGLAFVTREIYKWIIDLDEKIATPIIREQAYVIKDKVIQVEDETTESGFREETIQVRSNPITLKDYTSNPFKEVDINTLFKALQNPIEVSEDFMTELTILLQQALLMDTKSFVKKFHGLQDNQLEIDNGQID